MVPDIKLLKHEHGCLSIYQLKYAVDPYTQKVKTYLTIFCSIYRNGRDALYYLPNYW